MNRIRSRRSGVQLYTMAFEWDPKKAVSNARKHGIRFADTVAALEDDRAVTVRDDASEEDRWVTIGMDASGQIVVVVYAWRGENIRIISARLASRHEARHYTENL